jgi:hypothetical protein
VEVAESSIGSVEVKHIKGEKREAGRVEKTGVERRERTMSNIVIAQEERV